jgi:carbonic anhydrase
MTDDRKHLIDFAAYCKDLHEDLRADHEAAVLLLTCMDFRFFVLIAKEMERLDLTKDYDHVILAGAALGTVVPQKPKWHETFFDHVKLAKDLHKIKRIIVMEHEDCGAYGPKGFKLLPKDPDPIEERQVHWAKVSELAQKVRERYGTTLGFDAFFLEKPDQTESLSFDKMI